MRAGRRELPAHIFQRSENSSSAVEQRHSGVIVHEIDSLEGQALATVFLLHRGGHMTKRALYIYDNLLGLEDGIDEQRVQLLVRVVDAQLRLKK